MVWPPSGIFGVHVIPSRLMSLGFSYAMNGLMFLYKSRWDPISIRGRIGSPLRVQDPNNGVLGQKIDNINCILALKSYYLGSWNPDTDIGQISWIPYYGTTDAVCGSLSTRISAALYVVHTFGKLEAQSMIRGWGRKRDQPH